MPPGRLQRRDQNRCVGKLKKMVPDQMTEEADKKSRPLKDSSSMQDRWTQFEMYFIIFKLFYILYRKLL